MLSFHNDNLAMKWLKPCVLTIVLIVAASSMAQVITPMELSDPKARILQQRYLQALVAIGDEIEAHKFPFPFYFNRVLDVDLAKVKADDNRSIRFDFYKGETVLAITGNYYAAYSADRMDSYARMKETFEAVIMPMLQAAVPHFPDDSQFAAFAIEVSHHVRQKVMGVSSEHPENVTVIFPVLSAQRLVDAKTDDQRQAAVLEAQFFLNGQPTLLWLQEGAPPEEWIERNTALPAAKKQPVETAAAGANSPGPTPSVSANLLKGYSGHYSNLHPGGIVQTAARERRRDHAPDQEPGSGSSFPKLRTAKLYRISSRRLLTAIYSYPVKRGRWNVSLQTSGTRLRRARFPLSASRVGLLSACSGL